MAENTERRKNTRIDHISPLRVEEGQILSFSLPAKNDKEIKISGQIVWADDDGFGVIFINKS